MPPDVAASDFQAGGDDRISLTCRSQRQQRRGCEYCERATPVNRGGFGRTKCFQKQKISQTAHVHGQLLALVHAGGETNTAGRGLLMPSNGCCEGGHHVRGALRKRA